MALFDFNFYNGDVVNEGSSKIFAAFLTLSATAFGFFLSKWSERFSNNKKIKRAGESLINEIYLLEEPANKQVKALEAFIETLKEEKFNTPHLVSVISLNTSRVNDINRTDIVNFFEKHYKDKKETRKKVNKIMAAFDILTYNHELMKRLFEELLQRGTIEFERYRMNADLIVHHFSVCVTELEKQNVDPGTDPFIVAVNKLVKDNLMKDPVDDVFSLKKKFNLPLSELCAANRKDPRTDGFQPLSYQCNQAVSAILALKQEMAFKFDKIKNSISDQVVLLLQEIKDIKLK